jgi:demethylmenaquinone methyltransferase/2-methoxy-6-polyprenyl-1,4-benzoquinol methylase
MTESFAPDPTDMDTYAEMMRQSDSYRTPVMRAAIESLNLPAGSRGLDAGCGIGSNTFHLAEAVGADGHVTGVDRAHEFIKRANETARKSGLSNRVSFDQGDLNALPYKDDSFDWVWSVDCVGYMPTPPVPLLRGLTRIVKPGGTVAILMWSSQQLLPGYPVLEAKLNATVQGIAPFTAGSDPKTHHLRALSWLHDVGLTDCAADTFVGTAHAPLTEDVRKALLSLFDMRWGEPQSELSANDWELYQHLCRPESPDFILNIPDYYAYFTYSLFRGCVVK